MHVLNFEPGEYPFVIHGDYHFDLIIQICKSFNYLIVKNNLLKRPDEKRFKRCNRPLVKNGADITFHYLTIMNVFYFNNFI